MDTFDIIMYILLGIVVAVFVYIFIREGITCVSEKEAIVVERLGKFDRVMKAGFNIMTPYLCVKKNVWIKYAKSNEYGRNTVVERNSCRISLQDEVMDFPEQNVITRDNAKIVIDAVLNYKIVDPKKMVYSIQNLPNVLSRLLQAFLRDVAGSLDVDRIIEDSNILDRVTDDLAIITRNWGVHINFVRLQKVQADALSDVLAQKKNADFKNKEIVIQASSAKQTTIIKAEGARDRKIREAEGEAQQIISKARGQAEAVLNEALAETKSIQEISRSLEGSGEDPARYLMALKYINALKHVCSLPNTTVHFVPKETMLLQTASALGLNTIYPSK